MAFVKYISRKSMEGSMIVISNKVRLSKDWYEKLGSPQFVALLHNKDTREIGVMKCSGADPGALMVRDDGTAQYVYIVAVGFLKAIGLESKKVKLDERYDKTEDMMIGKIPV